jgi:pimeloyl-ACP methyl ester carboxylesterase
MPYANVPGARLYYEIHGAGDPLLLHPGFGCSVEIYWANTEALARSFRVIVFDPRGAGRSSIGDASATMQTYADDAAALLDQLGVPSAHVMGTSFGGMVAQHIALEHPSRVRRLVLACTTPGGPAHVLPPMENMVKFMAASEISDPIAAMKSTWPLNYSDEYAAANEADLVERALANEHLRSTAEGRAAQISAVQSHDTVARLAGLRSPTLVAHGDRDGTVPFENGRTLARAIPSARFSRYPGGRHLFFTECAGRLNAEITEFLAGDAPSK